MNDSGVNELIGFVNIINQITPENNENNLNDHQNQTHFNNLDEMQCSDHEKGLDNYTFTFIAPTQIEHSDATQCGNNNILGILNSWKLPQLYTVLQEKEIDFEALGYMNEKEAEELLIGQSLGTRIKFIHLLKKWQFSQGVRDITTDNNAEKSRNYFNQLHVLPDQNAQDANSDSGNISLIFILQQTPHGKFILKLPEQNNVLSDHNRAILIDEIVTYYINNKLSLGVNECEAMANQIEQLFPGETSVVYFQRRNKKKAKGQLYDRYNNRMAKLRELLPKRKRHTHIKAPSEIPETLTSISTDLRQLIEELKYNRDDTEIEAILSKWTTTSEYRLKWIKTLSKDKNVESIIREWPAYTQAYGPKLIDIDFQYLYPDVDNIFIKFDRFCNNILPIMEAKIIEPISKKLLNDFKLQKFVTPDSRTCITLLLLHALIKPTNKTLMRCTKKLIKYTIKDSQNSFMVLLPSTSDVDRYISNQLSIKSSHKQQLQPFIFVVGESFYSPNQFFFYWDNIKYKFASALAALDCVFKLFQVFNIKYPSESEPVWQFIQRFLYKIDTPFDDAFPSVNLLIKKLENAQMQQ